MIRSFKLAVLLTLCAFALSGCVVTPYVVDGLAAELAVEPEPDDPRFEALCDRYAGEIREFEPDPFEGVRLYGHIRRYDDDAGCDLDCLRWLEDGWRFVEVHAYRQRARIYGRRQIEVYVLSQEDAWPTRLDDAEGYSAPVEAVIAAFDGIRPWPGGLEYRAEFANDGERILHLRGARHGVTRGRFTGLRRLEDGALYGQGRFSLFNRGTVMQGGVDGRVASCPS